jgi:hypothetical protein
MEPNREQVVSETSGQKVCKTKKISREISEQ